MLIVGDAGVVTLDIARDLQNLNSRIRIEQIEGAGHGIQFDQAERIEGIVKSFLRDTSE